MQSRQTVSAEYIQGIVDGRTWFKRFQPDIDMMQNNIRNLKETMQMFGAGPVKDGLRGELHFMQNAIKSELIKVRKD